jgi:guanosine-3',5'-bis(diphosphate) 3'-pyrophosphohydrolase
VHTDIGNTCVGAKINGRPMPLTTELRNGDEVEIICSKAQLPPSAWQSIAVTGKARSAIRRATRDAVRAQYGKLGREILVRAFQRREKTFGEEAVSAALGRLSQKTTEDVLAAVGTRANYPRLMCFARSSRMRAQPKRRSEGANSSATTRAGSGSAR